MSDPLGLEYLRQALRKMETRLTRRIDATACAVVVTYALIQHFFK